MKSAFTKTFFCHIFGTKSKIIKSKETVFIELGLTVI
jgi:hypothetical protein